MVQKFKRLGQRTFASLSIYNYRLFIAGQMVSTLGTWIQIVAQTWLVLQLTQSATLVGLLTAAQFLPILLFGAYGGVLTDRYNKRLILMATQATLLIGALALAVLSFAGLLDVWMIFVLAGISGLVAAIDNPARQSFVMEMVGPDHVRNAVSLNSIVFNMSRVIGPGIAALLIANVGMSMCFLLNAGSFVAVLICLALMRKPELQLSQLQSRSKGQLAAGLRYVKRAPELATILIMVGLIGLFAYNFPVIIPVLAQTTFGTDAGGYALLASAMGAGSVIGGLVMASRKRSAFTHYATAAMALGVSILITAAMPTLHTAAAAFMLVGFCATSLMGLGNTLLQLRSKAAFRGRVLALWSVAVLGSAPLGGPIAGFISQQFGPRWGLVMGGVAALLAGAYGFVRHERAHRQPVKPATNVAA